MKYRLFQIEALGFISFILVFAAGLFVVYRFEGTKISKLPIFVILLILIFIFRKLSFLRVEKNGIHFTLEFYKMKFYCLKIIDFEKIKSLSIKNEVLIFNENSVTLNKRGINSNSFKSFFGSNKLSDFTFNYPFMFTPFLINSNFDEFLKEILDFLPDVNIEIDEYSKIILDKKNIKIKQIED